MHYCTLNFCFYGVAQHIIRSQKNSLCSWTTVVTITVQYTVQLPKENQSCQNVEFAVHSLGNWQFHLTLPPRS